MAHDRHPRRRKGDRFNKAKIKLFSYTSSHIQPEQQTSTRCHLAIKKYTRKEFLYLFLIAALPIHIWNFIMLFRDMNWMLEEYQFDVVLGYVAYSIAVAFVESLIFFPVALILSLFLPTRWQKETSLAVLATLTTVLSLWAISNQVYFLILESPPAWFTWIRLRVYYHQGLGFSILMCVILISIILPIFLIKKNPKFKKNILLAIDRLVLLTGIYFIVDIISIGYLVFRLAS